MGNVAELIIIQVTSLLIMFGIIAIDYIIRMWIDKAKGSLIFKRRLTWLRVATPIIAIIIIALNFSYSSTFVGKLTSYSIEISMLFYFIVHIHKKIFLYVTDCIAIILMLSKVMVKSFDMANFQSFLVLLISLAGVVVTILTNHLIFGHDVLSTKWSSRTIFVICLYSLSWWSILAVNSQLTMYDFLEQVIASIIYISIILSLDLVLKKQLRLLTQELDTDFLTGIGNRKAFDHAFNQLFDRHQTIRNEWYIVMFDIDDFKKINDEFGHAFGDAALRMIAKSINQQLYTLQLDASFFRVGGEEFAILLTYIDEKTVLEVIRQIKEMVRQLTIEANDGQIIKMTLSMGIAKRNLFDESTQSLYERADFYLYTAKKDGKDLVNYEGNNLTNL